MEGCVESRCKRVPYLKTSESISILTWLSGRLVVVAKGRKKPGTTIPASSSKPQFY
jgi:hypothetical protein